MKVFFFLGIVLYLFSFFIEESYILNLFSFLLLFSFTIFLMKSDKNFLIISLLFFYGYLSSSFICILAEYGGYFSEIQEFSYLTGAATRNTILAFFTLYFAKISFRWIYHNKIHFCRFTNDITFFENSILIGIYFCIVLSLFFIYIQYGHPNDYGYDRFDYWSKVAPSWGIDVKRAAEYWMIFLGVCYTRKKKRRYFVYFLIGLIVFYLVGDKFTSFLTSSMFFLMPILLLSKKNLFMYLFSIKSIIIILCFLIVVLLLIFLSYYSIYGDADTAISLIYVRLSLQAQMWWAVDSISNYSISDLAVIKDNFLGFFNGNLENTGIYYLMKLILPSSLYYDMLTNGVTLTMAYPANINFFFGYPLAIFIILIFGLLLGTLLGFTAKVIESGSGLCIVLVTLLYTLYTQIFLMGNNYYITSIRFIVAVLFLTLMLIISNSRYFKRRI